MAEHLARIIGTEEDRVNCPFFWKIGACRHGDQCSRAHYKPTSSQTLLIRHMYQNPPIAIAIAEGQESITEELYEDSAIHFESFYIELWLAVAACGPVEDIVVCDNIGDHIIGNVYIKFVDEEAAAVALQALAGRYYAGRQMQVEFTPVTDFREARCRQFVDGQCRRGGYCNFMHIKHAPRSLKRKLIRKMLQDHPEYRKMGSFRSLSPEAPLPRTRARDPGPRARDPGSRARDPGSRARDPGPRAPRHGNYRNRRSRSRSRSRPRRREERPKRQTSEERRAMIARWNTEREGGT